MVRLSSERTCTYMCRSMQLIKNKEEYWLAAGKGCIKDIADHAPSFL
jgi:hypothetical protein